MHRYAEQRRLEKDALKAREAAIERGETLPSVCGFVYTPNKPKNPPQGWKATPTTCMRTAGAGTKHFGKGYCDFHEHKAQTKQSLGNATRKAVVERASFFGMPVNMDPHTAVIEEIARTVGIIRYMEKVMQEMQDRGIPEDEIIAQFVMKEGMKPSVWMQILQWERDHLVKTSVAAIKAGIAERKVRIAEEQGKMVAAMLMAFMHDPELQLSPAQLMKAPALIRRHMTNLNITQSDGKPAELNRVIETTGSVNDD